ncbi:hypothetical protein BACCAP_04651 [Pseudoflavonifractor capillosus ATCC 29799]|uniref:Uncharacterized protein n=1 Tax=Pseudoflavonifractor capillosus ATCC 29799 TaxID=411467 RepID=A6P2C1_9FIRM|nr:hypothetical protein BACCAP_04651 [Pseudoflavonifractor capillosus ATCC 29799]
MAGRIFALPDEKKNKRPGGIAAWTQVAAKAAIAKLKG